MRAIDADALIETINRHCYPVQHDMTSIEPGMTRIGILQAIQEQPTIEPQRWIPCSERFPEEDTDILVTYVDGEETRIIPVNYGRGTWFDCIFDRALDSLNVIAWMPLPEPYRKEGEEI